MREYRQRGENWDECSNEPAPHLGLGSEKRGASVDRGHQRKAKLFPQPLAWVNSTLKRLEQNRKTIESISTIALRIGFNFPFGLISPVRR